MKVQRTSQERTGQVQSIARAISLLRILSECSKGASLKQLSAEAALAPSTAHRLLTTLQSERFVRFDPSTNIWQIGVGAFGVGSAFMRTRDLAAGARPHLERLSQKTGETASLYVAAEDHAVCMAQVPGRAARDAIAEVGDRLPLHTSAAGKAILSYLPREIVDQVVDERGANSSATPDALGRLMSRTRVMGHATDREENTIGIHCVAAAVLDETGYPMAAISVSGSADRIGPNRLVELGRMVREAACAITVDLGGMHEAAQ
jgi:IclR family acetate operon transcriptional repressor